MYKLISHTNPIDQKHSFGSFPLQAPYLTDMNESWQSVMGLREKNQRREERGNFTVHSQTTDDCWCR